MIHDNGKSIRIIGYEQSTVTQELFAALTTYGGKDNVCLPCEIITPEDFLNMSCHDQYQYAVGFNRDPEMRARVLHVIMAKKLNCPSIIHPTVFAAVSSLENYIGKGTFVAPYSSLMINCKVGDFCLLENYCMISHYVTVGDHVHMHPGAMIAGKTTIGDRCVFNFRSTVLNAITICADVEIGACSTVTKDITVPGRYVGTPARRVGDTQTALRNA